MFSFNGSFYGAGFFFRLYILASKNVCFAKALMSLFSLQITMFSQFGGMKNNAEIIMNIVLGLVVCMICVSMAVIMIVKANNKLKNIHFNNS